MLIEITYNVTDVYMSTTETPIYVEISFEQPGGSSAVWGAITGTLSDQTDLQNALNAKFDDPTGTTLQYIDGTGALQTFPLTLPVLQEVRNQTGATLAAGTVVYINGATGNKPTVTKAIATGDATSAQTLGMVSAAISNNGVGYVVVIGTCGGLDTSAFTEGQQLYLSYTTAGAVTTTKPYAPNHLVYVGIVTRSHPTLGTIEVRVQNGFEMDELHNVSAQTPSNNDGLFYNTTTSLWESKGITTALGYTPVPTTRNITINGVTYDLSADRTYTIAAGISGSGASGQVTYWTGASAVSGDNGLTWDIINKRLAINTNGQSTTISTYFATGSVGENIWIGGGGTLSQFTGGSTARNNTSCGVNALSAITTGSYNVAFGGNALISNSTGQQNNAFGYNTLFSNTTGSFNMGFGINALRNTTTGSNNIGIGAGAGWNSGTNANTTGSNNIFIGSSSIGVSATESNRTWIGTSSTTSTWLAGNLLLGTTTDGGQRLQVIGDTLLRGSGATSATTALTVQNSSSTNLFTVRNDGYAAINYNGTSAAANAGLEIITTSATATAMSSLAINGNSATGHKFLISHIGANSSAYLQNYSTSALNYRGIFFLGNEITFEVTNTNYAARIQALTVNVSGYVGINNTTPTALTDIGASTTTRASLRIRSGTAPTTPNDGDIWFDGTDIKMRIGGVTKTFTLI